MTEIILLIIIIFLMTILTLGIMYIFWFIVKTLNREEVNNLDEENF